MTKFGKILFVIAIIIALFGIVYFLQKKPTTVEAPIVEDEVKEENINLEILGNKDDLLSFSITPGAKIPAGILSYRGEIKGGYFFEANIQINILDANKNVLKKSNAMATSEWMTAGLVSFEGNIDFTGLPKGQAYFEIHNDNPSGLPENDKSILIPIVIEKTSVIFTDSTLPFLKSLVANNPYGNIQECKSSIDGSKLFKLYSNVLICDLSIIYYDENGKKLGVCGRGEVANRRGEVSNNCDLHPLESSCTTVYFQKPSDGSLCAYSEKKNTDVYGLK